MMPKPILIDTSAIVAIFSEDDHYHQVCVNTLTKLPPPQLTTWAVLTEVQWLLRKRPNAVSKVFTALNAGILSLPVIDELAANWFKTYSDKYKDTDIQVADASIMYLADTLNLNTVFTLDRRDFQVHRTSDNRALDIIPGLD